jgi:hypothetical protein
VERQEHTYSHFEEALQQLFERLLQGSVRSRRRGGHLARARLKRDSSEGNFVSRSHAAVNPQSARSSLEIGVRVVADKVPAAQHYIALHSITLHCIVSFPSMILTRLRFASHRLRPSPALLALFSSSARTMTTSNTAWHPATTRYPSVRRDESCVETFKSAEKGAVEVPDPYQWLHTPDSQETKEFVAKQGEFARAYLDKFPHADKFKQALTANWDYPRCE